MPLVFPVDVKKTLAAASAIALLIVVLVYFPDRDDGSGAILGGLLALIPIALGLAALPRVRPLPSRSAAVRIRLAVLALAVGLALGIANLTVNYGMAMLDPDIHQQMVTRWAKFSTWSVVFAEPVMEEIAYRLVLLTGLAWLVARFTDNRRTIFGVALGISAVLFGVAHIFYGGIDDPLYAAGMAIKTSAAGALFGWVFWRWGLPYSSICHCAANGIHLVLMPALF